MSYSVLFTWLYARTDGNLLVAVVFHAALNLFSVAGLDPARQSWWRALVYGLVALLLIATGGLRSGEGEASGQTFEDLEAGTATTKDGHVQHFEGHYVLRRSVVDGASAEQRAWHIHSADINKLK